MDPVLILVGSASLICLLLIVVFHQKRKLSIAISSFVNLQGEIQEVKNEHIKLAEASKAKHKEELEEVIGQLIATEEKYAPIIKVDKEIENRREQVRRLQIEIDQLRSKYEAGHSVFKQLERQIELYNESLELNEYGVYKPQYSFDLPEQYKLELESIYQKQRGLVQNGKAAFCATEWTVSGSAAEGRRMTRQYIKLMLYAFNGECEGLISKVRWNNVNKTKERIEKTFESINKLGVTHQVIITEEYLKLKLAELSLNYEYELKKYEEKEEQRRIREQMREEEKAQKEFEKAQREAEDEEKRYEKALEKARKELGLADAGELDALIEKIRFLEQNLHEAHEKKERAISLAQMTKVGHIYVISNIGSFGEDVYKIGMTRRLDPYDRVRELGDASVPFQFDIHAIIYSENAPQLEYELHKRFETKRINRVNGRKEFFRTSLQEIESFIREHTNAAMEFTRLAEAKEYRETLTLLEQITTETSQPGPKSELPETIFG
jgi:hypothetical protein